ncbi:MAG: SgcJ/EcaC family oxidoreductase [Chloroflexota bacterium]|nr:SgcJ/EcaC family oxidoreductase [Chloroflexota bacterium]
MVQAVRSRIEETNQQFMKAINRGDTSAVAALYTEDAVVLPPNAETVRGRAGAKALFDGMIQQLGIPVLTLSTIEVTELGDTAYEVGAYTMRLQPPGAAVVDDGGKYVVVWKRETDGAWKLAVDIWNTDLPMPGV